MVGAIAIVLVLVVIGPIGLLFGGAVWSAIVGFFAVDDAERRHEGSDFLEHRAW